MATDKYIKIRTFMNDSDREKQVVEHAMDWEKPARNPEELRELMVEAHSHPTHTLISFYDEQGNLLKNYPAAGKYLGGKEGIWGYYY